MRRGATRGTTPGREVCGHAWHMGAIMAATANMAPATRGLRIRPWRAEAPAHPPVREKLARLTPGRAL